MLFACQVTKEYTHILIMLNNDVIIPSKLITPIWCHKMFYCNNYKNEETKKQLKWLQSI
jgi:hypothetical protein